MAAWVRCGRAAAIAWALLAWGPPAAAQPADLTPNEPPLRPAITALLGLHDGGARLVQIPAEAEPLPGGRLGAPFDYLTAADGTIYKLGPDRVACWLPGTQGDGARFDALRGAQAAAILDGRLVGWTGTGTAERPQLVESRFTPCGPDFSLASEVRLEGEGDPPFYAPLNRTSGELFAARGGICALGAGGVGCRVGPDDEPRFAWWLTAEQIAERLPEGAAFARALLEASPELPQDRPITYALRDGQVLPDGRLAALLSATLPRQPDLAVWVNWVVLLDPQADTAVDLLEPAVQVLGGGFIYDNALGEAETLHYDAAWDALWVGRVFRWQPSSLVLSFGGVGTVDDVITQGRTGMGYRVIPLSGPHAGPQRNGYFDLTNAYFWLNPCEEERADTCVPFAQLGFGAVGDRQGRVFFKPTLNRVERRLVFDRDAVDLDGDGLSQAEEVALGTSDVDVDSDDDGAFDQVERWAGRDPTAADPPSLTVPVLQVPSDLLIQAPEPERARSRTGRSYAPDSPYCEYEGERGRCHDPAGRILVEWVSDTVADTPIVAADGSYVLFTTFDGVYQLPFATGVPERWISAADLHARIGDDITGGPESGFAAYQTWVPVDRQTLFLGTAFDRFSRERKGRFPRYERLDGAPGGPVTFTTLFDTEFDFCDAGLTRCTPETFDPIFDGLQWGPGTADPYERSPFWTVAMGYHHELQRFLVGVGGHQQSLLLGFHRDPGEPPARLSRARGLYPLDRQRYLGDAEFDWCVPFPGTVQAVKPGLYQVGEWRWRGPALEPVPVASLSGPSKALACDRGETLPYIAPWGSPSAFGHLMTGRDLGVLTPQRLSRGDTLLLGALSSRATGLEAEGMPDARMLYALGPWVGLRPLWDAPDPDLVRGTGLAVADDLRVCIADRPGQQVLEFLPEPGTDRPTVKGRRVTGVDAIACLWRGDELLVLTGDAVLAVDDGGGLREVQAHGAAQPVAFALDAEGTLQVLDRGQAGAPAGWIRRQDGTLEPIAADALAEGPFNAEIRIDVDASQPSTVLMGVERPDGTVLISHSSTLTEVDPYGVETFAIHQGVMMLDGRGGLRTVADPLRTTPGQPPSGQFAFQPIAQVPGDGPDLWQGAKGPVCWFDASLPECVVDRSGPEGPTPGGPDAGPGAGGDQPADDGGCQCAAQGGGAPSDGLWLLALWGLRRRRRRVA